jgi:hypothetical protein
VIQDHIESIGKPILLKGDEVLIMTQLLPLKKKDSIAQMLDDVAPKILNHFPKFIHIQTLNIQLDPTKNIYPGPTELILYTATAKP